MAGSLSLGAESLSWTETVRLLFTTTATDDTTAIILREIRLPRVLLAVLVGGGLAMAGAAYQGLFRNPLADPFVIGASSGAALGAAVVMVFGWQGGALGFGAVPLGAFLGALLAAAVVYASAAWSGGVPVVSLLLAGAAVSSFFGAAVWLLLFLNDKRLQIFVAWMIGSLNMRGWETVIGISPYLLGGAVGLGLLARPLDALAFGEETARSLGMRVRLMCGLVIAAASLTTAAAVAAGGIIGFVGLIAPHCARLLVGARHAVLLPASALMGALLLLLADDLARTAPLLLPSDDLAQTSRGLELPVGILTALLGGPFFLFLLRTRATGATWRV
jgi:iron complex transport system permease protein